MRLIKKVTRASSSQNYQFLQKRRKKTNEIEKIFFLEIAIPIPSKILSMKFTKYRKILLYKDGKKFRARKTLSQYSKILKTFNESTGTGPGRRNGELVRDRSGYCSIKKNTFTFRLSRWAEYKIHIM